MEVEGTVEALFIGRGEARRRGERWPAGELRGRAVMEVGTVLASRSGAVALMRRRAGVGGGA